MATNTGSGSRNLVFISYRRDTGLETARNICDRLSMSGIPTFFDFDSMRNGKFNDQIFEAIENASDFVLVVSRNALDRCRNTDDWVRIEIEHALKHNKNIVLVYTEPQLTFPDNFPPSLWDLKNYQGLHLSHEYYNESITKLMKMLNARPGRKSYRTAIYGAMIAVVAAGAGMWAFMDRDDRAEMLSPEAEVQIPVASAPAPAVVENVADTRTDAAAPAPDKSVSDTRERPSVRTTPDNTAMASVASTTPAVMQPTVAEVKKETPTAVKTKSRIGTSGRIRFRQSRGGLLSRHGLSEWRWCVEERQDSIQIFQGVGRSRRSRWHVPSGMVLPNGPRNRQEHQDR